MSATVLSGEPVAPDRTRRMEAPHQPPVGRPMWSENYAWVCYDPVRQAGVLLHLGRMPFDPLLWRSTVVAYLPAGRLVVAKGVAPSPDARPGNANLTLTCQRPLQQWSLAYVGAGRPTSHDTLGAGRLIAAASGWLGLVARVQRLIGVVGAFKRRNIISAHPARRAIGARRAGIHILRIPLTRAHANTELLHRITCTCAPLNRRSPVADDRLNGQAEGLGSRWPVLILRSYGNREGARRRIGMASPDFPSGAA